MNFDQAVDLERIRATFAHAAAPNAAPPDASVVIPVNAQGDLENVLHVIHDVAQYSGRRSLEMILVVNNFEPGGPPDVVANYEELGFRVVSVPDVRRSGEAIALSARLRGIRAARCEQVLLFDADCRIPDATAVIDQSRSGSGVAPTRWPSSTNRGVAPEWPRYWPLLGRH